MEEDEFRFVPTHFVQFEPTIKTKEKIINVKIKDIKINPERFSEQDEETVKKIAVSIEEIDLINPITISPSKELIAGLQRLKAYEMLGYTEIEAKVVDFDALRRELVELDENLLRKKYHFIKEGELLLRRKEIYELLYPETKRGQYGQKGSKVFTKVETAETAISTPPSFVQDVAAKTNVSSRTIYEKIQIAQNLSPEVKQLVRDLDITKSDALKLSTLEPDQQTQAIQKIAEHECKNMKQAIKSVLRSDEPEERAPPLSAKERVLILLKDSQIEEIEACISDLQRLLEQKKELKELVKEFEEKEFEEAEADLKENADERRERKESLERHFYHRQQHEPEDNQAEDNRQQAETGTGEAQSEAEAGAGGGD